MSQHNNKDKKESRFERFIRLKGDGIQVVGFSAIVGAAILSLLTGDGFIEWIITFFSFGAIVSLFLLGGGS